MSDFSELIHDSRLYRELAWEEIPSLLETAKEYDNKDIAIKALTLVAERSFKRIEDLEKIISVLVTDIGSISLDLHKLENRHKLE